MAAVVLCPNLTSRQQMLPSTVRAFVTGNHIGVLTTLRKSGVPQMSVVSTGAYRDGVAFTACDFRAKVVNLGRNPNCTLLVSRLDWSDYVVMEGSARVHSLGNTDPEELRLGLRDVQRSISGHEHPNWHEYDEEMRTGRYAIVIVYPEHYYGWIGGEVKNAEYFTAGSTP